jgi:hypothetical protein
MPDRICPCGKSFAIPALLKRHQNSKLGCIPYMMSLNSPKHDMHIEHKREERERAKVVKEFFCKYCNRKLASKFSMERHHSTCANNEDNKIKRDIAEINNNIINNSNIKYLLENIVNNIGNNKGNNKGELDIKMGELSIKYSFNSKFIDNQSIQSNQILKRNINIPELEINDAINTVTIPQTNIQSNVGNTIANNTYSSNVNGAFTNANNSINPIINNITNNITNNSISGNVPYVYPFGYENINFLTEREVIDILKSDNGAVLVLEKIYSHIENNNFMKSNKKDKFMMYINAPNNIAYCSDKEFISKLYDQSKLLLLRVYYQYYKRLTPKYQHIVWQNMQQINDTLDSKPHSIGEKYTYIIAKNTNDNECKKAFQNLKKGIETKDSPIVKDNTIAFNVSLLHITSLHEELAITTLNIEDINQIWEQLHSDGNVSYEEFENDLTLHRFEDTPRFKLIQTLLQKELEFKYKQNYNIGDIDNFSKYVKTRIDKELNLIRQYFTDITEEYIEEINNLLITKPFEDNFRYLQGLRQLLPNNKKDLIKIQTK